MVFLEILEAFFLCGFASNLDHRNVYEEELSGIMFAMEFVP